MEKAPNHPGKQSAISNEFKWARRAVLPIIAIVLTGYYLLLRFAELRSGWELAVVLTTGTAAYAVLALLIINQHPRHTIGWLFLITGYVGSLIILGAGLLAWAAQIDIKTIQAWAAWIDRQTLAPWIMIPIMLVLLHFPDGRLPSSRWKPVRFIVIVAIIYTQASEAFRPWVTDDWSLPFTATNPMAIPGSEAFFNGVFGTIFSAVQYLGILGALASVIVRFVRSKGTERVQMKWLVYASVFVIVLILSLALLGLGDDSLMYYVITFSPTLLALAMSIAILRHRLFDIDIIIRRTLQYSILSGVLALVYLGGVTLIQTVFFNGQSSQVAVVVSTLVIAALFNPLRLRIQQLIDRRFYRTQYDAEQVLEQFAATTRDEVEMEKLTRALLNTIQETMQPEKVSLWLREREQQTRNR